MSQLCTYKKRNILDICHNFNNSLSSSSFPTGLKYTDVRSALKRMTKPTRKTTHQLEFSQTPVKCVKGLCMTSCILTLMRFFLNYSEVFIMVIYGGKPQMSLQEIYRKNWIDLRCSSDNQFCHPFLYISFIDTFKYFMVLIYYKFYVLFICLFCLLICTIAFLRDS